MTAVSRKGQAYLLSHEATLAALALLTVPEEAPSLPVVAVVNPAQRERLRAIARQGGFSEDAVQRWDDRYLVPYHPEGPDDLRMATLEATRQLAQRLGVDAVMPTSVASLPDALEAFRARWFELLERFGLTVEPASWYPEAVQDLFRAAQA